MVTQTAGLAPAMPDCTISFIRQQSLTRVGFLEAGSRGAAPGGGFGGVPQASLPFAATGGVPKKRAPAKANGPLVAPRKTLDEKEG